MIPTVTRNFPGKTRESAARCFTSLPLSWCDHLSAILVNQGSDPTVPYQALVIREGAMLSLGFTPWGR